MIDFSKGGILKLEPIAAKEMLEPINHFLYTRCYSDFLYTRFSDAHGRQCRSAACFATADEAETEWRGRLARARLPDTRPFLYASDWSPSPRGGLA